MSKPNKEIVSTLVSRNVTVEGHRTSVRLEPEMWLGLMDICHRERATMHEVCTAISRHKSINTSLTAAIRVFIMAYFRSAATEDGHSRAGHGQGLISIAIASNTHNPNNATGTTRPSAASLFASISRS